MGYYKRHKGDYYRGDYYRGDFWDDLVSGAENIGSSIVSGFGGGVQRLGKAAEQLFLPTPPATGTSALQATSPGNPGPLIGAPRPRLLGAPASPTMAGSPPQNGAAAALATVRALRSGAGRQTSGSTHTAFRHVDSWEVRDRRVMNPLNPHALRRAIRRGRSFQKFAMKQLRLEGIHRKVKGFKHQKKKT